MALGRQSEIFVSADWLAERLNAPDLVVVDGSWYLPAMGRNGLAEYLASHIPGAVYFDIDEISDHSSDLPHMLPPPETFALHMARLGIGDGMKPVVYDGSGLYGAARVWWTFRVFGVREASILEGGFPQWCADGHPVESGMVTRAPKHFTPRLHRSAVADLETVEAALAAGTAEVVDARSAARFRGEAPEPRAGVRPGRIPGSRNVPYDHVVQNGRLRDPESLRAAFAAGGVDIEKPVITSCGSGVSAALLWLALERIGKTPQALYDGSWAEWGSRPDKPAASGPVEPLSKTDDR